LGTINSTQADDTPVTKSVNSVSIKEREIKIGELLRALGLVKEMQLQETLRLAVQAGLPLGRALIAGGYLSEEELNVALELQTFIRSGELTLAEAIRVFGLVSSDRVTFEEALELLGHARPQLPVETNRFGTLLLDARLVTPKQLHQAERMCHEAGVPLEKALGLLGFIPHAVLSRATELQAMVRDARITYRDAVRLLGPKGSLRGISNGRKVKCEPAQGRPRVRLVEMLLVSNVLSEQDLMNAIDDALTTGKSLQELLVETGALPEDAVKLAMQLQQSISDGDLTLAAAADALRYVGTKDGIRTPPGVQTPTSPPDLMRLGDLLQLAGFVDSKDIQQALELSARYGSLIGKMLVVSGAISETALLASLRAQALLRNGKITCEDAVRALQYAERSKRPFDDVLQDLKINLIGESGGKSKLSSV
jgi:hypothetical protein